MAMEDDEPAPRPHTLTRPLDRLGVAELEAYIAELRTEITRTEAEITRKRAINNAANSIFNI